MDATGQRITFDAVAREAGVSRSWLYAQDDLRAEIERSGSATPRSLTGGSAPEATGLRRLLPRRLEAATARVRQLVEADNRQLRDALARALGERQTAEVLGHPSSPDTPKRSSPKLIGPC